MMTLIAKDLRQSLWPLLLAMTLLIAPPLAWAAFKLGDRDPMPRGLHLQHELMSVFLFGAVGSLAAASSIAGVAFAKERRERTGDLLATLPLSRSKVFISKAMVAVFLAVVPFAASAAIGMAVAPHDARTELWASFTQDGSALWVIAVIASGWLLLFGLGWGLSSVLRSEVLAAAIPIVVVIILPTSIALWTQPARPTYGGITRSSESLTLPRFIYPMATIGATGLIGGTLIALRRKSP